ncbi:PadR family transcriptional regulator [Radiobacillus deserti]|uniref:PadR family transcriptional regulator n=1 Tax=Radiobacillus deserti TaxID=2594883 RepID=A0A516KI86_9BACI|nr:PadR family transcriptional regulator [Radiobacillus deserti]QDP41118.1 PadR family transcriptional regulator [Radiobacillus deserti]
MDQRLKGLKKAMKHTVFQDLEFTEQHKQNVHQRLQNHEEDEHVMLVAILQLLVAEKTGFELAKQLRSRGITTFEDQEGFLYTHLHQLEQKGYIGACWDEDIKRYKISQDGTRLLNKLTDKKQRLSLIKRLWVEVSSN